VPPLFGFWPKLLVFNAAVDAGYIALAVAGIVGAVIGAYYYLRIVKVIYIDAPAEQPMARGGPRVEGLLILLAALFVSPIGFLFMGPLGDLSRRAAASLF